MFGAKPTTSFGFGNTASQGQAQPATTFGGFGASTSQPAAVPAFGGFGANATTQQTTGFGGFGQSTQQQPQQQQQQSGFGAPQPAQGGFGTTGGTSLFGGATNNATASGGGLFGGAPMSTSNNNLFGAPSQPAGGLFGQSSTQQPTGLFGAPAQAQSQPQNQFNPAAAPNQRFPNQAQQLQNPKARVYSESGFPSYYGPSGRLVPIGVFTNREVPREETWEIMKKEDPVMAQELQRMKETLRKQQDAWDLIKPEDLGTKILSNQRQIAELQTGYNTYLSSCLSLKSSIDALNHKLSDFFKEVSGVWRVSEWQKENGETQRGFEVVRDVPADFFIKLGRENKERIEQYMRTIDQVERQLYSLSQDQKIPTVQAISDTINNNQDVILTLASQVADLDARVQRMADEYRKDYRRRNQTIEDPIEVARAAKGQPEGGHARDGGIGLKGMSLRG